MKRAIALVFLFFVLALQIILFAQVNFEPAVRKNTVAQRGNNIRYADAFGSVSSNGGARIALAIADLPSTGGTVDARGLQGAQTLSSTIAFGSKPIRLILGATTYTYAGGGAAITMSPGSIVEGAGQGAAILKISSSADAITPAANATIRNLTLRGNVTVVDGYSAVDGCDCDNVTIEKTEIYDFGSHAINTGGVSKNWTASKNYIHDNDGAGFFGATTSDGHLIEGNTFRANGANTIDINAPNVRVVNNFIDGGGTTHPGDCSAVLITSVGAGQNADGAIVEGNQILNHTCNAVFIRADNSGTSSYHTIKNNLISGTLGFAGIIIDLSIGATCGTTNYINIEGNQVVNGDGFGIVVGGGAGTPCIAIGNRVHNNTVINNDDGGIAVSYGTATRVTDNTVLLNTAYQLSLVTGTLDFCNLTDTTVNHCTVGSGLGSLATNSIRPAPGGSTVTLDSVGNTELALTSTGAGRLPWSFILDSAGNLQVYDITAVLPRLTINPSSGLVRLPYGFTVGASAFGVTQILPGQATLDLPNAVAQTVSGATATLTGVADGDICLPPGVPAGSTIANVFWSCQVTGANQITVYMHNYSTGAINPGNITFNYTVIHF